MSENKNIVEIDKLKTKLTSLEELTERVSTNLNNMNTAIEETVATGKGIWDGESANQFKASWSSVNEEIPSFIEVFEKQANNLNSFINKMSSINDN